MRLPLRDTLFARLMAYQLVVAAIAGALFVLLVIVERNTILAEPFAELVAPRIAALAARRADTPRPAAVAGDFPISRLMVASQPPAVPGFSISSMPGVAALLEALGRQGVGVREARLGLEDPPTLWLDVKTDTATPLWIGLPVPDDVLRWSRRMTVGVMVLVLATLIVSWAFARRVTHPLEILTRAMQADARPGEVVRHAGGRRATAEILALQAAFIELTRRLRRQERERSLLLAGVSHDLRAPLTRVRLAAQMLPERADTLRAVELITRSVDHADRLVGNFLDVVRAHHVPLDQEVDAWALAQDCVLTCGAPGVELLPENGTACRLTNASALLLQRALLNLIDNAIKHGAAPVSVAVRHGAGYVCIEVRDGGAGVPPQEALVLQDAFARGDRSRGKPGVGLGLAIARAAAERHGGRLSLGQVPGGFQVSLVIPVRRPPTAAASRAAAV